MRRTAGGGYPPSARRAARVCHPTRPSSAGVQHPRVGWNLRSRGPRLACRCCRQPTGPSRRAMRRAVSRWCDPWMVEKKRLCIPTGSREGTDGGQRVPCHLYQAGPGRSGGVGGRSGAIYIASRFEIVSIYSIAGRIREFDMRCVFARTALPYLVCPQCVLCGRRRGACGQWRVVEVMKIFDPVGIRATDMSLSSEKNSPSLDLVVQTTSPLVTERKKRHRSIVTNGWGRPRRGGKCALTENLNTSPNKPVAGVRIDLQGIAKREEAYSIHPRP